MTRMSMEAKLAMMETFGWYTVYEDDERRFIRYCAP